MSKGIDLTSDWFRSGTEETFGNYTAKGVVQDGVKLLTLSDGDRSSLRLIAERPLEIDGANFCKFPYGIKSIAPFGIEEDRFTHHYGGSSQGERGLGTFFRLMGPEWIGMNPNDFTTLHGTLWRQPTTDLTLNLVDSGPKAKLKFSSKLVKPALDGKLNATFYTQLERHGIFESSIEIENVSGQELDSIYLGFHGPNIKVPVGGRIYSTAPVDGMDILDATPEFKKRFSENSNSTLFLPDKLNIESEALLVNAQHPTNDYSQVVIDLNNGFVMVQTTNFVGNGRLDGHWYWETLSNPETARKGYGDRGSDGSGVYNGFASLFTSSGGPYGLEGSRQRGEHGISLRDKEKMRFRMRNRFTSIDKLPNILKESEDRGGKLFTAV
jgi:hypothetical protein